MPNPVKSSQPIHVGVGGWTYAPWRGPFYDKGVKHADELAFMSRRLGVVEVNGTFYRSQTPATFRKWHDETPDHFLFALKAPRFATNRKNLAEAGESIDRFVASGIAELGDKLGPINWQLAPTKRFQPEEFESFLSLLPDKAGGIGLKHAVEARHESFLDDAVAQIARRHGVAIVLAADSDYPRIDVATAPFAYLRIMGTSESEADGYAPSAMDGWASAAREMATGHKNASIASAASGPREVFLFVISGFKERNPQAALGIAGRLDSSSRPGRHPKKGTERP